MSTKKGKNKGLAAASSSSSASPSTHSIEYNDIILGLSDLISSETNKYLDKKANKSKFTDDTIKTQVNNFFKTDSTIIGGAETAATAADNAASALSVTQRKKNITKAITDYLKTPINETTVENKYTELAGAASGSAAVPLPTVPSGTPVVTALATATPVTASGIPIVAAATTTTDTPYEIILDTDKMKFFVYNLFAHDLAHDLFPSGTGLKRIVEIKNDTTNPTRKTWINSDLAYGGGNVYTNEVYAKDIMFLDDVDKTNDKEIREQETKEEETKKQEIQQYNKEIKEFEPYVKKEVELTDTVDDSLLNETYLLSKKTELSKLIETDKTEDKTKNKTEEKNIKNIEGEIEKAKTGIIINKTREFSIDVVKSAGITLEQKGMLWINKDKTRLKRENITNKLFLIIDVDTIINDFIGVPNETTADLNEIYLKNPMYPGYIYFDNYIIHPYDITVTRSIKTSKIDTNFTLKFNTINSDGTNTKHNIAFSPYLDKFDIFFDEKNVFRKLCYYDNRCEINFKEAYNSVVTDNKDVNAYDFFSSIFNNYINVEISDDMDSYFYFLYPKFLLKHRKDETIQKFNELLDSIKNGNVDGPIKEYIENYKEPFECFQTKICKYLQKKQNEFLSKYGYKDEDNNPEFLFPKNIQNCGNKDFYLFILSKMFAQMIVTENKVEIFKNIDEIVEKYRSENEPDFNPVANEDDGETFNDPEPEYISFLKLVLLNYPTVSKQIKNQSGGGVNDNYHKNAARIISTSVASIMYYLDKVIVPTNNILNTEINICQNIVTKQQASNIDDKLFDDFYTWITMTKYAGDLKYYNNNVASSLPSVSFDKKAASIISNKKSSPATSTEPAYSSDTIVGLPEVNFWNWLEIGKPDQDNKKLFFINNAASAPNKLSSERLKKSYLLNWFTKERINAKDPTEKESELTQSQVNDMITDVNSTSKPNSGTSKEKADLILKDKYESYDTPEPDNKFWFCPFSSIIDGQPTCRRFFNRGDIKEKGTLYVTVRNLKSTTTPGGGVDPNEMIYTIKVEPKSGFNDDLSGEHKVLVHVLLKIGGVKIIDYGTLDSKGVAAAATSAATMTDGQLPSDPAIEMDLDSPTSYLDAKECMIRLIDLSIGLLKNHSDIIRPWGQLITKLKSDNIVTSSSSVAVKMPFKLHTPGTVSTYTNAEYTSDQLRQKILRTSVIKSLGDYSQELNMLTKKSGYIDEPKTIPRFKDNKKATADKEDVGTETSIRKPEDIRLGLSVDRPSGVRLVLLKLFGKENEKNKAKSGTNPRSIVGYYDTLSKAMIAYDKSQFPGAPGASTNVYSTNVEPIAAGYGGGKKIIRKSRKRNKGITKKRKILLKNRKVSKRNNKGTRKRK